MGFLEKGMEKAVTSQKQAIEKEAKANGCEILEINDLIDGSNQGMTAVSGSLKSLFGGRTKTTALQCYKIFGHEMTFFFFQPFEGVEALPGEYHVMLECSVDNALILGKTMLGGGKWNSSGDEGIAAAFNTDKQIKAAVKNIVWKWQSGFTEIKLDWTVQVKPAGPNRIHLVMKNGRYGGFTTYGIGVGVLLNLCRAVRQAAASETHTTPLPFIKQTSFGGIFEEISVKGKNN